MLTSEPPLTSPLPPQPSAILTTTTVLSVQVSQGLAGAAKKDSIWLAPAPQSDAAYGPELHTTAAVLRLLGGVAAA